MQSATHTQHSRPTGPAAWFSPKYRPPVWPARPPGHTSARSSACPGWPARSLPAPADCASRDSCRSRVDRPAPESDGRTPRSRDSCEMRKMGLGSASSFGQMCVGSNFHTFFTFTFLHFHANSTQFSNAVVKRLHLQPLSEYLLCNVALR